jgi:fucose permease
MRRLYLKSTGIFVSLVAFSLHESSATFVARKVTIPARERLLAILGGAVALLLMGWLADRFSIRIGFLTPLVCFVAVTTYWFLWSRLFAQDMTGTTGEE